MDSTRVAHLAELGGLRLDGESMARTNAENPWVGRYRCADGRWIHLHGGFPSLAERLASLLDLLADADDTAIGAPLGAGRPSW